MSSSPRGYAVVITMTKDRPGADVDEKNIAELFQQLNFHVKKLKDKTKNVKCFVLFVFTINMVSCCEKNYEILFKWSPT